MIEKLNIPKFESEAEEAEWWDQHREETSKWMEEAVTAGRTTTLPAVLQRARERSEMPTFRVRQFIMTADFLESAHKLEKDQARRVWKALDQFARNANHPSLHRKRLKGDSDGLESIRVSDDLRIILRLGEFPALLYVGPHDEAYRFASRTSTVRAQQVGEQVSRPQVQGLLVRTRKYLPLAQFLLSRAPRGDSVTLSFEDIETLIGGALPPSARRYNAWWANDESRHAQTTAWLAIGWRTRGLDLKSERVTFVRASN